MRRIIHGFIILFISLANTALSQEYQGTIGLLHVPSAETDSSGTFRGGISYLDKHFLPQAFSARYYNYNTVGYTIGLSVCRWLEVSYSAALLKYTVKEKSPDPRFYNEDRHVDLKVIPLYEGKWWPSIALGWDDLGSLRIFKCDKGITTSQYFENIYLVCSKHFKIKGYEIGAHIAYRYYSAVDNRDRTGVAGGLTFVPRLGQSLQGPRAWLQRPRLIVEWDGIGVNVGADVLLWRHLFIQAALIHGQGFTGGLAYHYTIKF